MNINNRAIDSNNITKEQYNKYAIEMFDIAEIPVKHWIIASENILNNKKKSLDFLENHLFHENILTDYLIGKTLGIKINNKLMVYCLKVVNKNYKLELDYDTLSETEKNIFYNMEVGVRFVYDKLLKTMIKENLRSPFFNDLILQLDKHNMIFKPIFLHELELQKNMMEKKIKFLQTPDEVLKEDNLSQQDAINLYSQIKENNIDKLIKKIKILDTFLQTNVVTTEIEMINTELSKLPVIGIMRLEYIMKGTHLTNQDKLNIQDRLKKILSFYSI